jgi:hypothetical protein
VIASLIFTQAILQSTITDLEAGELMEKIDAHKHSVGHSYRSGAVRVVHRNGRSARFTRLFGAGFLRVEVVLACLAGDQFAFTGDAEALGE